MEITRSSAAAGAPTFIIARHVVHSGLQWDTSKRRYLSDRKKYPKNVTTPIAIETRLATAAPETPSERPVPQPKIRTGASTMLSATVPALMTIVGLTIPVPRNDEPIATTRNWRSNAGMNQF